MLTDLHNHRRVVGDSELAEAVKLGIRVITKDGHVIWLNAIQKWNIAVWLNRLTRADETANELTERLARHHANRPYA